MRAGVHGEEEEGGGVGLFVPVESVEAGELEFEEGVVDAEDDVGHDNHEGQVQHDDGLEPHDDAEGVDHCQGVDENAELGDDNGHCEQHEEDGQDGVDDGFDFAVPEPLHFIDKLVLGLNDEGGVYPLVGVVHVGHYIFNQKGLERQLLPPALQSGQLQQHFLDFFMDFYEVDFSQVRNGFFPHISIVLGNQVGYVYALGALSVFLLVPVQLFDFEFQLVDNF